MCKISKFIKFLQMIKENEAVNNYQSNYRAASSIDYNQSLTTVRPIWLAHENFFNFRALTTDIESAPGVGNLNTLGG